MQIWGLNVWGIKLMGPQGGMMRGQAGNSEAQEEGMYRLRATEILLHDSEVSLQFESSGQPMCREISFATSLKPI